MYEGQGCWEGARNARTVGTCRAGGRGDSSVGRSSWNQINVKFKFAVWEGLHVFIYLLIYLFVRWFCRGRSKVKLGQHAVLREMLRWPRRPQTRSDRLDLSLYPVGPNSHRIEIIPIQLSLVAESVARHTISAHAEVLPLESKNTQRFLAYFFFLLGTVSH